MHKQRDFKEYKMRKIFIIGLLALLLTKCTKNHSFETNSHFGELKIDLD